MIAQVGELLLNTSLIFVVVSLAMYLVVISASRRVNARTKALVKVGADHEPEDHELDDPALIGHEPEVDASESVADLEVADEPTPAPAKVKKSLNVAGFATAFSIVALVLITGYLILRTIESGHGPFANMHEFAVSFSWGIMVAFLVALWRFKARIVSLFVLPVVAGLLIFALQAGIEIEPLLPALQNSLMLTLHVSFAVLSYGAAAVSFGAAVAYLLHPTLKLKTPRDRFDEIGYKGAVVCFPLMTVMILLGAVWANTAWGRYWGWDPKETAALVTWLVYAGFLHARIVAGWRGTRAAVFLLIGFAAVMFAYFGNYFLGGLHTYS